MAYFFNGQKRYFAYRNGKLVQILGLATKQLLAPTISLDGDTLTITATDSRTETFAIFVDGVEMATVANTAETISFTLYFYYSYTDELSAMGTITVAQGTTWREWAETEPEFDIHGKVNVTSSDDTLTCGDAPALYDSKSGDNIIHPDDVIEANAIYYFISKSK